MITTELEAWSACSKAKTSKMFFFHNQPDYKIIVANLLDKYQKLGFNMSIKLRVLNLHGNIFPNNLSNYSE